MKKMAYRSISILSALLLGVGLSGCATSFQQHNLQPVEIYPTVSQPKSIAVDLAFSGKLNGEPWTAQNEQNTVYLKKLCIETLGNSGLFSAVSPSAQGADLKLQIAIIHEKTTPKNRQTLTALTLFIVPYKSTDTFQLLAIVTDQKTGTRKRIELEDGVTHYQQLLMVPFSLFTSPDRALQDCRQRLFENLCLEIHRSGLLQ